MFTRNLDGFGLGEGTDIEVRAAICPSKVEATGLGEFANWRQVGGRKSINKFGKGECNNRTLL